MLKTDSTKKLGKYYPLILLLLAIGIVGAINAIILYTTSPYTLLLLLVVGYGLIAFHISDRYVSTDTTGFPTHLFLSVSENISEGGGVKFTQSKILHKGDVIVKSAPDWNFLIYQVLFFSNLGVWAMYIYLLSIPDTSMLIVTLILIVLIAYLYTFYRIFKPPTICIQNNRLSTTGMLLRNVCFPISDIKYIQFAPWQTPIGGRNNYRLDFYTTNKLLLTIICPHDFSLPSFARLIAIIQPWAKEMNIPFRHTKECAQTQKKQVLYPQNPISPTIEEEHEP